MNPPFRKPRRPRGASGDFLKFMFGYSEILKKAWAITRDFPVLWVFGLFVAGGFSLNLLRYASFPAQLSRHPFSSAEILAYFGGHPLSLGVLSLSLLAASAFGLLLTNWCRIMLALLTKSVLENGRPRLLWQLKAGPRFMRPVIKVSILTSMLIILVALSLLGATFWSGLDFESRVFLWALAGFIFMPMAYTISCVNIFTVFFIVFSGYDFKTALNLGTDFFIANWIKILGLGLVLSVIFLAGSAVGGFLVLFGRLCEKFLESYGGLGFFWNSAMIFTVRGIFALLLWAILAAVNVFFNTSLLLLFLKLIAPVKKEEAAGAEKLSVFPAAL